MAEILMKLGEKKKAEAINAGKVYYGLLYYRVFLWYVAGVFSVDVIIAAIFDDFIQGTPAMLIALFGGLPLAAVYIFFYSKSFIKKYLSGNMCEQNQNLSKSGQLTTKPVKSGITDAMLELCEKARGSSDKLHIYLNAWVEDQIITLFQAELLYKEYMRKKDDAFTETVPSVLEEKIKGSDNKSCTWPMIGDALRDTLCSFHDDSEKVDVKKICDVLIAALSQRDYDIWVAVTLSESGEKKEITYLMLEHETLGERYMAYTGLYSEKFEADYGLVCLSARYFLGVVAKDSASGLVLDYQCCQGAPIELSRENIFRILYYSQINSKGTANMSGKNFDKEFVFAQKGLIYDLVENAIIAWSNDNNAETSNKLGIAMSYAVQYNISYRVVVNGPAYAIFQNRNYGRIYMAFTNMKVAEQFEEGKSNFAKVRSLFQHVLQDNVNGLTLIHEVEGKGYVEMFFSKEHIRKILHYGFEQIQAQPKIVREFMLKEL